MSSWNAILHARDFMRVGLLLSGVGIMLGGCVYAAPGPYAYDTPPNYDYAYPPPAYYSPGYVYGPSLYIGPHIDFHDRRDRH